LVSPVPRWICGEVERPVVYDNQLGDADAADAIEGGSIVIHER
jgi:hypothetical protein